MLKIGCSDPIKAAFYSPGINPTPAGSIGHMVLAGKTKKLGAV